MKISNGFDPSSDPGIVLIENKEVEPVNEDYNLIRDGLENSPFVARSGTKGWMVMNIEDKKIVNIDNKTDEQDLIKRFRVYNKIAKTTEELRETSDITVDWELFEDIYEVWEKKRTEKTAS